MDNLNLSPAARATLLALPDAPGNVHEIAERTGRSRSGTDKALRELAKAELIAKIDGGDPADGAPARWQLTDAGHTAAAELDTTTADDGAGKAPAVAEAAAGSDPYTDTDTNPNAAAALEADPTDTEPGDSPDPDEVPQDPPPGTGEADTNQPPAEQADQPGTGDSTADTSHDAEHANTAEQEADEPKICRGCGNQLPRICPHCWQKTPSYCGTCRQNMPQARRGEPGEPSVLPSGLPRLRPGELEKLVMEVVNSQSLPHHVGITGWTAQRVAIYLPGRSTGAIGNALSKLTKTGELELIGEQPMRYQLSGAGETAEPADDNEDNT
jgi:DNA-binding MarR family transcriptional regulator